MNTTENNMTPVTEQILIELGFTLEGNRWIHEKGTFIYTNKIPTGLKSLVDTMTGTAFKKGLNSRKNDI